MTITQQIITIGLCVAEQCSLASCHLQFLMKKTNSCIRAVSRKISAACGIRYACRILPQKCGYSVCTTRTSRIHIRDCDWCTPYMEKADAPLYRGRNYLLYAAYPYDDMRVKRYFLSYNHRAISTFLPQNATPYFVISIIPLSIISVS